MSAETGYGLATAVKNTAGDFQFCHVPTGSYELRISPDGSLWGRLPVEVGADERFKWAAAGSRAGR